ncbi:cation:proton antiporter [Amorphus sp. 3PC139-8]|uniref:cation:proton antiporter n=1 Tax=Amorphus sp. 3PC139-8 TaxID=2735676 RepID=UPI00345CB52B
MDFNAALAVSAGTVFVLGIVAGYVKSRLWVSETTICLALGILIGPSAWRLIDLADLPVDRFTLLKEVARVTLAIAVMGAALRLPTRYELNRLRDLVVALAIGLPLMWITSALLAYLILGAPLLTALLIGAALAPTDPVVAGSITGGQLAEARLPDRLRHLLTAESGANDGLALLFVMLAILLLTKAPPEALSEWIVRVFLWEICGAIAIGLAAGWLAGRLLSWAYKQPFTENPSTITVGLALSLTVLAGVRLIGSDGILAVFAAGLMLNRVVTERQTRHEHMQEAISRFFDLPVFILIGLMLPWSAWGNLGWPGVVFAAAILLLRRLPWWLALCPLTREMKTVRDAAFLGWFGPIGVATTYYAVLSQEEAGIDLWPILSLVVFASVVVHGLSATPLTQAMRPETENRSA